jgi:hypothetical protein
VTQLQRKEKIEEERGKVSGGSRWNKKTKKEEGKFFSDLASEKRENRGRKRKSFR